MHLENAGGALHQRIKRCGQPESQENNQQRKADHRPGFPARELTARETIGRAEYQLRGVVKETTKNRDHQDDKHDHHADLLSGEPGTQNSKLTLKHAERWRPGYGQGCQQEHWRAYGQSVEQPSSTFLERIVSGMLLEIAGTEEQQRLGHGMEC